MGDTYARILNKILDHYKPHTTRIVQFLSYFERPLTIDVAADALAVEIGPRRFDCDWL